MNSQYHCTFVRYERRGGALVPVRVRREWVRGGSDGGQDRFAVVRVTEVPWAHVRDRQTGPGGWRSCTGGDAQTREALLAKGLVVPSGRGPALALDEWARANAAAELEGRTPPRYWPAPWANAGRSEGHSNHAP